MCYVEEILVVVEGSEYGEPVLHLVDSESGEVLMLGLLSN